MNMYTYCSNNSMNMVDPSGLSVIIGQVLPPRDALSVVPEQMLEGWREAFVLFSQWVNGTGPDNWILGRSNALVEELINTEAIEAARQKFIEANAGLPLNEWTSITYRYDFTPIEMLKAGLNPALQFLGSFDVMITPRETEDGTETITVTNRVSWSSYWRWVKYFGYPVPPSWGRNTFRRCGNMTVTMKWPESVLPVTDTNEWMGLLIDSRHWRYFNMHLQEEFVHGIAYHPDVGVVNVDISRFNFFEPE